VHVRFPEEGPDFNPKSDLEFLPFVRAFALYIKNLFINVLDRKR